MPRVVRPEAYAARRNEILDVAQRLVMLTKGYSGMAVQDILDGARISKGAFYHYFDSKQALLEALIDRLASEATPMLRQIVSDPDLPALAKLHAFFGKIARWKTDRRDYLMALLDVWYADENALVREKLRSEMPERYGPLLTQVIRQGIAEGVMTTVHPEEVSRVIFSILYDLGLDFASLLRLGAEDPDVLDRAFKRVEMYNDAVERVLGAPPGSLTLLDAHTIHAWFDPVVAARGASKT